MYVGWCSIHNFLVILRYLWTMVVCIFFILALIFVYGVGLCVDVGGVVCVAECCLFL